MRSASLPIWRADAVPPCDGATNTRPHPARDQPARNRGRRRCRLGSGRPATAAHRPDDRAACRARPQSLPGGAQRSGRSRGPRGGLGDDSSSTRTGRPHRWPLPSGLGHSVGTGDAVGADTLRSSNGRLWLGSRVDQPHCRRTENNLGSGGGYRPGVEYWCPQPTPGRVWRAQWDRTSDRNQS